jgi:putative tryptophan/tyrosine transport system substrate-binding protein
MRRREFITLLGGAATTVAWPLAARAQQQGKVRSIGILSGGSQAATSLLRAAFVQGMGELGYTEGKDFVLEVRTVEGRYERIPEIATEFLQLKIDVIVTGLSASLPILKRAVTRIPIVMAYSTDPVGTGLVASLDRPGGNMTGLASLSEDTSPKQLELLRAVAPNASRIGLLGNPNSNTYAPVLKNAQVAAEKAGLTLLPVEVRDPQEIEKAFISFAKERVSATISAADAVLFTNRQRIAELAIANRVATMFPQREYVVAGGLMSYGESLTDFFRRAAAYVDKIFKGANPGELPIEQPTRFNLVINRKTADTLGITIPSQLYIFADEVID